MFSKLLFNEIVNKVTCRIGGMSDEDLVDMYDAIADNEVVVNTFEALDEIETLGISTRTTPQLAYGMGFETGRAYEAQVRKTLDACPTNVVN